MPAVVKIGAPGALRVDRRTAWGNPFVLGKDGSRVQVIAKYSRWLRSQPQLIERLSELRGRDLACHCAPLPCHADVLLRLANARH
jgi:hypothetical protein